MRVVKVEFVAPVTFEEVPVVFAALLGISPLERVVPAVINPFAL